MLLSVFVCVADVLICRCRRDITRPSLCCRYVLLRFTFDIFDVVLGVSYFIVCVLLSCVCLRAAVDRSHKPFRCCLVMIC